MNKKKDIFDKIMSLKGIKLFYPFYEKHKEMLLYLFFGGLSFVVSVISYAYFYYAVEWNELIANFFSWVLAVLFAYVTNKIWVFDAPAGSVYRFWDSLQDFLEAGFLHL